MLKEKTIKFLPILLVSAFAILKTVSYSNSLRGWKVFLWSDDAIYAIMAQRLIDGDFFSAFHPYWNAGFPIAQIPFYLITGSFEMAQILVSAVSHVILILVIYFTLRRFSESLAVVAAFIAAFSPSFSKLVLYGGMTEPLYILLLWLAIYFGWQALETPKLKYYALTGCFFGLAYFTRTEAIYTLVTFLAIAFLSLILKKRKKLKFFNKITLLFMLGAIAVYFYFPFARLSKFTTFGFSIFNSTKGAVLAIPFLIIAMLAVPFELKKLNLRIIFSNIAPKLGIMLGLFLLVNLPYITVISTNLGKPTLSGKYAYIGSAHPFTPEKDRMTTWAQDIWSIDFPNYRSPYYDSARTLSRMWKYIEHSVDAFLKSVKENLNFYGNENIFTNKEIAFIIFGFLAAALQARFRRFSLYLATIWLISFIFVSYFMSAAIIRYLAFSFPIIYTSYAFAVLGIGQLLSRLNKVLLPLTLVSFCFLFFDKNFDSNTLFNVQGYGRNTDQKEIGDWLKSQRIDLIMARTEGISLYSGAKLVYMPAANPETIVKFAKAWGVEYLVSRPVESSWYYMRAIVDPNFKHPDLALKHRFEDGTLIWKVKLTEDERFYNFRTSKDVNKKFEDININSQIIIER